MSKIVLCAGPADGSADGDGSNGVDDGERMSASSEASKVKYNMYRHCHLEVSEETMRSSILTKETGLGLTVDQNKRQAQATM